MALRSIVDQALGAMPIADRILRVAGRLPPILRSRTSTRALSALARRHTECDPLAPTNYGIDPRLRCLVPSAQWNARFGKPALYTGERGALELCRVLSRSADAFLDIGAHLGIFTFHVRMQGSSSVPIHFFEPDPSLFRLLDRNVHVNGLGQVTGHEAAVGAADGQARFYVNRSDSFSGSLTTGFADRHRVEPIQVQVRTFAAMARELGFGRACVKVDVEYAEEEFARGARGAFDRIAYLIIEILGPAQSRGFVRELQALTGFHAYYVNDYNLEHSRDGSYVYRAPEYNWLFCRDNPESLSQRLGQTALRVRA